MSRPDWQLLLQQGIRAVQARQGKAALDLLQQAKQLQPASRDVAYWLGNAQRLCGLAADAEACFKSLVTDNPLDFETALALAFLLREQARLTELDQLLIRFARQPAVETPALLQIAGMLRDSNRFQSAIEVMREVLERESDEAVHHFRLARLYQGTGQHEAALQAYSDTLQRDPAIGGAWLGLATLQRFASENDADWQKLLSAPSDRGNSETAMCIAFARAKGYDDLGQYAQAWSHYQEGNRLRQQSQPWDSQGWSSLMKQALSAPLKPQLAASPQRKPVFIVGMLRSGTTLLEQLLARHPGITARGELNFLALAWKLWQQGATGPALADELAAQIWQHLRLDGSQDQIYIDKNPLNFRFLPLLAASMPEARILHLRRDGRDSCLSCFMQLFQHPDSAFSNRLDDLWQYYRDYLQLISHFEQAMPGQILTLAYEDLVKDSDAALEKVWDFLGVAPLESGTAERASVTTEQRPIRTASTWQARQDVHQKSVGRWQSYHQFAAEFFDQIHDLDRQFRRPRGSRN